MSRGAIIVKLGDENLIFENQQKNERETREFLLSKLSELIKTNRKEDIESIHVKYDPNYEWL